MCEERSTCETGWSVKGGKRLVGTPGNLLTGPLNRQGVTFCFLWPTVTERHRSHDRLEPVVSVLLTVFASSSTQLTQKKDILF